MAAWHDAVVAMLSYVGGDCGGCGGGDDDEDEDDRTMRWLEG